MQPRDAELRGQAERRLLKALCDAKLPTAVRAEVCAQLQPAHFADVTHRVIFEEIRTATTTDHPASSQRLREHLPGRITARGFPDIDFECLLLCENESTEELSTRVRRARDELKAFPAAE
jgi:hypothetical protein